MMGPLLYASVRFPWKRTMTIFSLSLILPGLALQMPKVHKSQTRFNWTHLTPLKLKDRSVGLSTESKGRHTPYFTLAGHKFQIFGGSIHYFRVPRAYWKDRLLKLQACGFNTVTTYIPWNLHEQERGRFDFSENLDLEAYVQQAAKIGLWVILRPGPYICGEVDLGGLPSWLLRDPKPQLRTTDKGFVEAVDKYFDHLIPRILPLQYHRGGPVIALRVENEYGSFNKDEDYMAYIKEALVKRGIVEMLFTADDKEGIVNGSVKGALATINLGSYMKDSFTQLYQVQNVRILWLVVLLKTPGGYWRKEMVERNGLVQTNFEGWKDGSEVAEGLAPTLQLTTTLNSSSKLSISFPLSISHMEVKLLVPWEVDNSYFDKEGKGLSKPLSSFKCKSLMSLAKISPKMKNKPIMIMEYWTGWFDTWGSVHRVKSAKEVERTVSKFIKNGISFNAYMFHGGTNFGFINGALNYQNHIGVVTSYDYDAMLTEAGDYTKKYFRLRKLFASVSAARLPQLPHHTPKAVYPSVKPSVYLPLFEILPYLNKPVMSHNVLTMENLPINHDSGQPFGLVLYETSICSGGQLHASAHDLAQVFLNDKNIGVLNMYRQYLHIPEFQLKNSRVQKCQLLRILVENQGRVNYSWKIQNEWKGLAGSVSINNVSLNDFTIYSLDMKLSFFKSLHFAAWKPILEHYPGPAFYRGILRVGSLPKDTFLSLPNWKYGLVFINGRNLGRYHDTGPQKTLYLPGAWLHPEDNEIILFERMHSGSYIETTDKPML